MLMSIGHILVNQILSQISSSKFGQNLVLIDGNILTEFRRQI